MLGSGTAISALMQLVSRPANISARAAAGRISDSLQEAALGLGVLLILFDQSPYSLGHETRHGLVAGGCVNTEPSQQSLRQTERDVLVCLHWWLVWRLISLYGVGPVRGGGSEFYHA